MHKGERTNLLDYNNNDDSRTDRRSSGGDSDSGGFEIGMHEIESSKIDGPSSGIRERTSSSGSATGSIKPTLRYKGTNYMSTSAFQTMAEEIVRQRHHAETMAKSRSHDGNTVQL